MFTLRLQRQGRKKDFIYRVAAIDSRFSVKSGKAKEILGWWDPKTDKFQLKTDRISYWLKNGIQPTDSCYNLLIKAKLISGKKRKIPIRKKESKKKKEEAKEEKNKEEKPKTEPVELSTIET